MNAPRKPRRVRHQKRQSVLWVMAVILGASGVLRMTGQVGAATAAQTEAPASAGVVRADQILGMPLDDQTLPQLLEEFQAREAALLAAEARAEAREDALAKSAEAVAAQLEELAAAEAKLAETLALTDAAAADDLARLAMVYENMKPRDTAALFTEMAPGFAAGFLGLMRPEAAAAIMTELEPNTAHLISVMLAGRNAGGPQRD